MACPTCDHTMQMIATPYYWCPRCGTLGGGLVQKPEFWEPKLVDRCRKYAGEFDKENIAQFYRNTWNRLGIAEAINKPEDR
jgi:hypothetical protein